jgi:Tfp pilus assembly protein PilN
MRAVNLIPSEDRRVGGVGAGRSGGAAYAVLGVLAGLAILVLLYGVARHNVSSRRTQLAQAQAQTQRAHESASGLASYTSFLTLREQRVQAVTQLVDSRFDWAQSLHELGRVLPHGTTISSLNGTIGSETSSGSKPASSASSTVSSATPPGSVPTFTLTGCSASQAQVALALQRLHLVDGVQKVSLQSSSKTATGVATAGTGQCTSGHPSFTVQLDFAPLPAVSSSSKSTQLTSSTGGGQ